MTRADERLAAIERGIGANRNAEGLRDLAWATGELRKMVETMRIISGGVSQASAAAHARITLAGFEWSAKL